MQAELPDTLPELEELLMRIKAKLDQLRAEQELQLTRHNLIESEWQQRNTEKVEALRLYLQLKYNPSDRQIFVENLKHAWRNTLNAEIRYSMEQRRHDD